MSLELDGRRRPSGFGTFLKGIFFGVLVFGLGFVALAVFGPAPEMAAERDEVVAALPDASPAPATPEPFSERPFALPEEAPAAGPAPQPVAPAGTAAAPAPQPSAPAAAAGPSAPSVSPAPGLASGDATAGDALARLATDAGAGAGASPAGSAPTSLPGALPTPGLPPAPTGLNAAPLPPAEDDGGVGALATATDVLPEPEETIAEEDPPLIDLAGPAIEVNAQPFSMPAGAPKLAVVLEFALANELPAETLLAMSVPLTLAVAPLGEAELAVATDARKAGYEVLAIIDTEGAGVADVAPGLPREELRARLEPKLAFLSMSVGAMNRAGSAATDNPGFVRDLLWVLKDHGFAFVENRGPEADDTLRIASEMGAAHGLRRMTLPDTGQVDEIIAALDEAATRAAAEGGIIVTGQATRQTLQGVLLWSLQNNGRVASLAPISAVVERP